MIGKVITSLLKENSGLTDIIPDSKMYAYIINEDTELPALIYVVNSVTPLYTKDGWVNDTCDFSVLAFSSSYSQLQDISYLIRDALELKSGIITDVEIQKIYLSSHSEGYNINENVFMCKLDFNVKIIGYEF